MKKNLVIALLGLFAAIVPELSQAGACDTNANALERNLNQRCASRTGADCRTCVQGQYDTLTRAVPDTCKQAGGAVFERRREWEESHCG